MFLYCIKIKQSTLKESIKLSFCGKNDAQIKGFAVGDCSIIASRIGGGWISAFFVMLRDGE